MLDEMFSPVVAAGLRNRDVDVYALTERPELRRLSDSDVLELATTESRMAVTFNVKDFQSLHQVWMNSGRTHRGLVLVTHRRFRRQSGAVGPLVTALAELVIEPRADLPRPGAVCFL